MPLQAGSLYIVDQRYFASMRLHTFSRYYPCIYSFVPCLFPCPCCSFCCFLGPSIIIKTIPNPFSNTRKYCIRHFTSPAMANSYITVTDKPAPGTQQRYIIWMNVTNVGMQHSFRQQAAGRENMPHGLSYECHWSVTWWPIRQTSGWRWETGQTRIVR